MQCICSRSSFVSAEHKSKEPKEATENKKWKDVLTLLLCGKAAVPIGKCTIYDATYYPCF
jgi:hypothetical protein